MPTDTAQKANDDASVMNPAPTTGDTTETKRADTASSSREKRTTVQPAAVLNRCLTEKHGLNSLIHRALGIIPARLIWDFAEH